MNERINKTTGVVKHQDIFALLIFLLISVFMVIRCPYGLDNDDVSFYLTIPFRITQGDVLLVDEWHLSQLSAFILYPIVEIYTRVVGSTDGIILFFGYLFIAFQFFISSMVYVRFRKYGLLSITASTICFLNVPMVYLTLNYHSMGVGFVTLIGLLFISKWKKLSTVKYILIGILTALTVLCNPMYTIVYIVYTLIMILHELFKNSKPYYYIIKKKDFSFSVWLKMTVGILLIAIMFFVLILYKVDLKEILDNFPNLLSDPEYRFSDINTHAANLIDFNESFKTIIAKSPILVTVFFVNLVAIFFDKKCTEHRVIYFFISAVDFIIFLFVIASQTSRFEYGFCMFPLAIFGFTCYCLCEEKPKRKFVFLWLLGLIYSICLDIESDGGPTVAVLGLLVSNLSSVIFVKGLLEEMRAKGELQFGISKKIIQFFDKNKPEKLEKHLSLYTKKIMKIMTMIVIVTALSQIALQLYILCDINSCCYEYDTVNDDGYYEKLDCTVPKGPMKGLKVTKRRLKNIEDEMTDLDIIKENCNGPVLVTENYPWQYLYLEKPFGTYSAWSVSAYWFCGGAGSRLPIYYDLHHDKIPQYIYVPKSSLVDYDHDDAMTSKIMEDLESKFKFENENGKRGYILKVIEYTGHIN